MPHQDYDEHCQRILDSWGASSNNQKRTSTSMDSDADMEPCSKRIHASPAMMGAASPAMAATVFSPFDQAPMNFLRGSLFVGHINTDLDSVAGAIGAAHLFDGVAAISENKLNGEITFALEQCNLPVPALFEDIEGHEQKRIVLVDHTEGSQMVPKIDQELRKNICGIIDHHALAKNFATDSPIFMDIRPWGSMSTIVTHMYIQLKKHLPVAVAKILMSAIISDTLFLKSPTTTPADIFAVKLLSRYCGMDDAALQAYAMSMFQAKTKWICSLGPQALVRADTKVFESARGTKFAIGVLEIAGSPEPVLKLEESILKEMEIFRAEKNVEQVFLFVVDVVSQTSIAIVPGREEAAYVESAFNLTSSGEESTPTPDSDNSPTASSRGFSNTIAVGKYASRKKQFLPKLQKSISQ